RDAVHLTCLAIAAVGGPVHLVILLVAQQRRRRVLDLGAVAYAPHAPLVDGERLLIVLARDLDRRRIVGQVPDRFFGLLLDAVHLDDDRRYCAIAAQLLALGQQRPGQLRDELGQELVAVEVVAGAVAE